MMPWLDRYKDGRLLLRLYVQPRASRDGLAGLHDGALKLRLTSPPLDGKANRAVVGFLARTLGVPRSSIVLHRGQSSRHKQILISGLDEEMVRSRLKIS